MSEEILKQIMDKLNQMDSRLDKMDSRLDKMDSRFDQMDSRFDQMDSRLDRVEAAVAEIPYIKQAVMEVSEATKRIESNQISFERKVMAELNTHSYSIDILQREQFKMKTDIEMLKNR